MNLNMLKAIIKPFLPAFQGYLNQMSNPIEDGGYLQPGDNMVGITIYSDSDGIQIAAMSYRFGINPEGTPIITVTSANSLGNFEMLK